MLARHFKGLAGAIVGAALMAGMAAGSGAQAQAVVDCDAGGSIQAILDSLDLLQKVTVATSGGTISVLGTCTEDVTIGIDKARGGVVECLNVTGSGTGVLGTNGSVFTVRSANLSDNEGSGVIVDNASTAKIESSLMENNDPQGIGVVDGSHAAFTGNTIRGSFFSGVVAKDGGSVELFDNTIVDNGLTTQDCGLLNQLP